MEQVCVTSMRTAAVSVIAAKHLAKKGFKTNHRMWLTEYSMIKYVIVFDHIERVFVYDHFLHVHALLIDGNNSVLD